MGGVALSVERFPVLSPLSDKGAEGIASPDVQLFIIDEELFGPGLSKSIPCLWRMRKKDTCVYIRIKWSDTLPHFPQTISEDRVYIIYYLLKKCSLRHFIVAAR